MVINMKIKLHIPTPDDSQTKHTTSFLLNCSLTKDQLNARRYNSLRPNHLVK